MKRAAVDELEVEPRAREALAQLFRQLDDETWRHVQRMILYGSVARRDSGPLSDVDLLVVWDGTEVEGMDRFARASTRVLIDTGVDIAVQVVVSGDFARIRDARTSFYENIEREGILVAG